MKVSIEYIGPPDQKGSTKEKLRWIKGIGPVNATAIVNGKACVLDLTPDAREKVFDTLFMRAFDILDMAVQEIEPNIIPPNEIFIEPKKDPAMTPQSQSNDLGQALAGHVLPYVLEQVQTQIDKAVGALVPREIVIKQAKQPDVKIEGHVHPVFDKVIKLVGQNVNVLLVGPAGCGKTYLFSQVAKAMGLESSSISLSAGVTEAHITGRLLPTGDGGRFEYHSSPFVKRYIEGGAFLFDEMDGGDPNVLLSVNQALANGGFDIEARAASGLPTYVARHPKSLIMSTANTYGTGSGAVYVGRNQLDAASLDRFYVIEMDYDKAFENTLAPSKVVNFVWGLRDTIKANRWKRVASTRMIQKGAAALAAGLDWSEVKNDLLAGYTSEERAKIGG